MDIKTNLIITVGSRDIVLIEEVEGLTGKKAGQNFQLISNRKGGKVLLDQLETYKDKIVYPIIKPAVDYVLTQTGLINRIILVCTDQNSNDEIDDFFKNNDTIETAKVLEKLLFDYYGSKIREIKKLPITRNLIYYDAMYDFFEEKFDSKMLRFGLNDNVYLFTQGGVDAVNTALLLKTIERYPQVQQLNKPENSQTAFPLSFPAKFRNNLNKQQILHDLENYNYAAILTVDYSRKVIALAQYAYKRVSFDYDEASKQINYLLENDQTNRAFYTKLANEIRADTQSFYFRQKEAYLTAKIKYQQQAYSDFLVQMFSLAENILKPKVEEYLNGKIIYNEGDNHKEWNELLNTKPELIDYLNQQKIDGNQLIYSKPNRAVFKTIFNYAVQENQADLLNRLYKDLDELTKLRNRVAHELVKVNKTDINNYLSTNNSNIEQLLDIADEYFEVDAFDIYDEINEKIKSML